MRTTGVLLAVLLLATTVLAQPAEAIPAPAPAEPVAGHPAACGAWSADVPSAPCGRPVPDCRPVYVTIHQDPFWLEPDVQPTCPDEWVDHAWELVWGLLPTPRVSGSGPVGMVGVPVEPPERPPPPCSEQAALAGGGVCTMVLPECSIVSVTVHKDPFWLEPEVREGCLDEWKFFILGLLRP